MSEIKSCTYDNDENVLNLVFSGGKKQVIALSDIERNIPMSITMQSKYLWLLDNEPSTVVELYLSGELEAHLVWYEASCHEQEAGIRKQLEQHYDPAAARAMAREFVMYDS